MWHIEQFVIPCGGTVRVEFSEASLWGARVSISTSNSKLFRISELSVHFAEVFRSDDGSLSKSVWSEDDGTVSVC